MAHHSRTLCAVCLRACELELGVEDEWGRAVHASCYGQKRVSSNVCAQSKYDEVEDLLQQARELREATEQLIKKSDCLIQAYKRLTGQR